MSGKIGALVAAVVLALGGVGAKLAHLGPFADDAVRVLDTAVMTAPEFRGNYQALRNGTLVEKQAAEVACAFFTSYANTGTAPSEWGEFDTALADRMGVSSSRQYLTGKVERVKLAVELVQRNPAYARTYAETCVL